jgi:hypothetical protein
MIKKYTPTVAIFTFQGVGGAYPLPHYGTPEADIPSFSTPAEARVWSRSLAPVPPAPPPPTEAELLERAKANEIARLKQEHATASGSPFYFQGVQVNTDRNTRDDLNDLVTTAGLDPTFTVEYPVKLEDGTETFMELNGQMGAGMLLAIANRQKQLNTQLKADIAAVAAWTEIPQAEEPAEPAEPAEPEVE